MTTLTSATLVTTSVSEMTLFMLNQRRTYSAGLSGDIRDTFGMIWRFAPMADPLVDEWHSRDLDSVISDREAAAVNDWRSNRLV